MPLFEDQGPWAGNRILLLSTKIAKFAQVREHAAGVLAGLMKGGDEDLAGDFRDRAYIEANSIQRRRKTRYFYVFVPLNVMYLI